MKIKFIWMAFKKNVIPNFYNKHFFLLLKLTPHKLNREQNVDIKWNEKSKQKTEVTTAYKVVKKLSACCICIKSTYRLPYRELEINATCQNVMARCRYFSCLWLAAGVVHSWTMWSRGEVEKESVWLHVEFNAFYFFSSSSSPLPTSLIPCFCCFDVNKHFLKSN